MANAPVFPVPVWAQPIKSLPDNTIGIDCSWMGVEDSLAQIRLVYFRKW
jgi:hypothetical protein